MEYLKDYSLVLVVFFGMGSLFVSLDRLLESHLLVSLSHLLVNLHRLLVSPPLLVSLRRLLMSLRHLLVNLALYS
ncbi:hypothetical protein KEH51_22640 [[Brevibacterium] frigoritolerans]|uniref:Uncharacterized protein n=1 Tax=Peribacillus frigoritolerans TaxID=450367 RepID=A0A941J8J7_9BACI|nr:hypothetical protein [Peribacillus frigoritolerans]